MQGLLADPEARELFLWFLSEPDVQMQSKPGHRHCALAVSSVSCSEMLDFPSRSTLVQSAGRVVLSQ